MTSTRPAPPDTTDVVGMGTQERYEYDLLLQDRGHEVRHPHLDERIHQTGPDPAPVTQGRPGDLSAAITKSSRNGPENVHETACTIPAMAHIPTRVRDDLHPNVDMATVAGTIKSSSRLYTIDRRTGDAYLIDTGADRSTIPPTESDRRRPSSANVAWAANNSPIRTYGERRITLGLGFGRTVTWVFLIADDRQCIIGVDFPPSQQSVGLPVTHGS